MARLVAFVLLGCLLTGVSCLVQFINPPPFGQIGDFSGNPTYAAGSTVNIAWTNVEEGKGVSIVLYQLNETNGQWFGDMEYLTQGATGVTSYSWLVGTRKNLSTSNLFYLSIYQEGKAVSDSNSHYFNIENRDATVPSISSSSNSPSSTSSGASSAKSGASPTTNFLANASTSSQLPSLASTNAPISVSSSATQSSSSVTSSNNFPATAKIGIGIGIPAALAVGIGADFFLFRQHKKKSNIVISTTAVPHTEYQHHGGGYHNSNVNEAPMKSPVELSYYGDPYIAYHNHQAKRAVDKDDGIVHYEM
ncbi:hypothetical protein EJ07DRAFT_157928 [Lizonia empirigonia]|nr:hypothetical protein EJ07DRAFT_157928 [Lizonia empirigonia]